MRQLSFGCAKHLWVITELVKSDKRKQSIPAALQLEVGWKQAGHVRFAVASHVLSRMQPALGAILASSVVQAPSSPCLPRAELDSDRSWCGGRDGRISVWGSP